MDNKVLNNKRIAKNTAMLYIRMLFLMFINLYTSRIILNSLGIEDYGIYNVVGGFVAMFSMISTSLAGAISRYLTFSLAKDSKERLREVFSTSLIIQFALCLLLVLIAETLGIWFLNTQMDIPDSRLLAANWVFQISILTTLINLISIPYNSLIIAHERMSAFAYIGIYEGVAKLIIALVTPLSSHDLLIFFAVLMCLLSVSVRMLYGYYCKKNFKESKFKLVFDKVLLKDMFGFAGWNFIGTTSGVLRNQGINILINVFCGPAVNAARGIAVQVESAIYGFSTNFTTAVRPQITKLYAIGEKASYENLLIKATKFSFYILMIICIPVIFNANFIINKWLVDVPPYTVEFVCIILLLMLIDTYSVILIHLLLATGNIKKYQILVGSIQLLNFPLAYILLKLGFNPVSTVASVIFVSIVCLFARLYMLKKMVQFPVKEFFIRVILRTAIVFVLCIAIATPLKYIHIANEWLQFIVDSIIIVIICLTNITVFGLTKSEKEFIRSSIVRFIKR